MHYYSEHQYAVGFTKMSLLIHNFFIAPNFLLPSTKSIETINQNTGNITAIVLIGSILGLYRETCITPLILPLISKFEISQRHIPKKVFIESPIIPMEITALILYSKVSHYLLKIHYSCNTTEVGIEQLVKCPSIGRAHDLKYMWYNIFSCQPKASSLVVVDFQNPPHWHQEVLL